MRSAREAALLLLRKAREDLIAAECLASDPRISSWTAAFHVQQSIEKSLKSLLALRGVTYPFTHDLASLVKLAALSSIELPLVSTEYAYLTPFASFFRYEEEFESPPPVDMNEIIHWARELAEWSDSVLNATDP